MAEIGCTPGANTPGSLAPKNITIGINIRYDMTPPANIMPAMRGPMM